MAYSPTAANAFKGPVASQSGSWVGQDCDSAVGKLAESVKKISDKAVRKSRKEAQKAKKDFENKKTGGLFDQLTAGPLAELRTKMAEVQAQAEETQGASQGLIGDFGNYLSMGQTYAGMAMGMASNVVPDVVDDYKFINGITEAVGLGPLVPSGEASQCNKMLLQGMAGSVVRVAGRTVSTAVQAAMAAQSTIGLAFDVIPEIYAGIMSMPAGTLSILLTNKSAILTKIHNHVEDVVRIANGMTDDDYSSDPSAFIKEVLSNLDMADEDLGAVEQTLENGGKFLEVNWDRAETIIEDAGEACLKHGGYEINFALLKLLRLLGYSKSIDMLSKILADRQAAFQKLSNLIGKFTANFEAHSTFKNNSAPFVQQVRCKLQTVMQDMEKTLEKNSVLTYLIKEKRWGGELTILSILMNQIEAMIGWSSAPSNELNSLADTLSTEVGGWEATSGQTESYETLRSLLGVFVKETNRKMASNVDPAVLEGIAGAIYTEITILNASDSELEGFLNKFNSGMAADGLVAVQAVAGIVDFMEMAGLDNMIDALARGDWENVFSWDALTTQAEDSAIKAVADLLQCCRDNAGNGDTTRRLTRINKVMRTFKKGKDTYEKYTTGFASTHFAITAKKIIPALQKIKADTQRVSTSTCVNKGETGAVSSTLSALRLTLG